MYLSDFTFSFSHICQRCLHSFYVLRKVFIIQPCNFFRGAVGAFCSQKYRQCPLVAMDDIYEYILIYKFLQNLSRRTSCITKTVHGTDNTVFMETTELQLLQGKAMHLGSTSSYGAVDLQMFFFSNILALT